MDDAGPLIQAAILGTMGDQSEHVSYSLSGCLLCCDFHPVFSLISPSAGNSSSCDGTNLHASKD